MENSNCSIDDEPSKIAEPRLEGSNRELYEPI